MKNKYLAILLLLFLIPSILALLHPGFFRTDDGEWMVIRFSAFYQALRDGQFPVRFLTRLNYGYGYPVANFLYPGFMYLGVPIKIAGFGFVNTIKIIFGLSMVFSGIFSYVWLSKLFKNIPALIGALLYVYAPYHLYDIYVRGSVGEILALAIIPFIFWQIERNDFSLIAFGIGLLMISHNTLALMFTPLIGIYMMLNVYIARKTSLLVNYIISFILGLGFSAFFWIPALHDLQYTNFSSIQVSDYSQYFAPTNLIGLSIISIYILTGVFILTRRIDIKKHRLTILFFMCGLIALFLSMSISMSLWKILPVAFIQFPYRMLSVTIVCGALVAASCVSVIIKRMYLFVLFLLIVVGISAYPYIMPSDFFNKGEGFYATNEGTTTVKNEYMPRWVKEVPTKHPIDIIQGQNLDIYNINTTSNHIAFTARTKDTKKSSLFQINIIYFPGWRLKIDGINSPISYTNNPMGIMMGDLSAGTHRVEANYRGFTGNLLWDIISAMSVIVMIGMYLKRKFI